MRIIINLADLVKSLPLPEAVKGAELIVLCKDANMPVQLFNEIAAKNIAANFLTLPAKAKAEDEMFLIGFYAGNTEDEAVYVGKNKLPLDSITGETTIKTVAALSDLTGSQKKKPAAKAASPKEPAAKKPAASKVETKPVAKTPAKEPVKKVEKIEETAKKKPASRRSIPAAIDETPTATGKGNKTKFKNALKKLGIEAMIPEGKDFATVSDQILAAVQDAAEVVSFEIQLSVKLLDRELSSKVYQVLRPSFDDLKAMA